MSLKSFIAAECCNHHNGDGCHGQTLWEPYRIWNKSGKCLVLKGEPCWFFRETLLKIATQRGLYDELLPAYKKIDPKLIQSERTCECGTVLPSKRRLCDKCAEKKRKATYRAAYHKSKSHTQQLAQNGKMQTVGAVDVANCEKPDFGTLD